MNDPAPGETTRLDLRLVPAAATAWGVTAAGISWGAGTALAALCTALALGWWAVADPTACIPSNESKEEGRR